MLHTYLDTDSMSQYLLFPPHPLLSLPPRAPRESCLLWALCGDVSLCPNRIGIGVCIGHRCTFKPGSSDCVLVNDPTSPDHSCTTLWWSSLGEHCKAVAVLNIGNTTNVTQTVLFKDIGAAVSGSDSYEVHHAYQGLQQPTRIDGGFMQTVHANEGALLVVSPKGLSPRDCV